ncbi:MAG TPA: hypothetical protein VG709_00430, partial [Actinomycetota bacterium]|nr:hypothetical protein [Actinomycetota bacterium]
MTESTDRTITGGVRAADLAEVAREVGTVATVYLATEPDVENAGQRSELRWKNARTALADAGAPEEALTAIGS